MEAHQQRLRELEIENARLRKTIDGSRLAQLERECRRLEARIDQIQTMEAIGILAGGIAHDFNNILASFIGFTELALDEVKKGTRLEDNLQEAFRASMRAKDLVHQILTIVRQTDEPPRPVRIDIIAKELLKFLRAALPAGISITKNIVCRNMVRGSLLGIHQILINLCAHAGQAMAADGGILDVRLNDISVEAANDMGLSPGDYVEIIVTASGKGGAGVKLDSLWAEGGDALGLSVVRDRVDGYGGKITAQRYEDYGAMVRIFLPAIKRPRHQTRGDRAEGPSGSENILFIDDEDPITKMGRRTLEKRGYQVTISAAGAGALEMVAQSPDRFDLVVSDMTMPDITGDRLAARIRAVRADMPIILCTGYSRRIDPRKADQLGIQALLIKPFTGQVLAETVRRVLDGFPAG